MRVNYKLYFVDFFYKQRNLCIQFNGNIYSGIFELNKKL